MQYGHVEITGDKRAVEALRRIISKAAVQRPGVTLFLERERTRRSRHIMEMGFEVNGSNKLAAGEGEDDGE